MSELVVAGGTGQEVALATLRLGYLTGAEIPRIWIFDSDVGTTTPGADTQSRSQVLQSLHEQLKRLGPLGSPRLHFLNPSVLPQRTEKVERIGDVFAEHGHVSADGEALLGLLFDEDQKRTSINDGFHGEPALGALTLAAGFEAGAYREFLDELGTVAATHDGLRVVLAGSLSGGTGTSVVPFVAREVRRLSPAARICGLFQLPWFRLTKLERDQTTRAPDVDEAMFDRNSSCLLRGYLEQTFTNEIDSVVLLGLPDAVPRASHGGHIQPETKHYVCLIAGMIATNLLRQSSTDMMLGQEGRGFHAPTLTTSPRTAAYDGSPGGPALYLDGRSPVSVGRLIEIARALVALSEALVFETKCVQPSWAHQTLVFQTLRALNSAPERENFRKTIEGFHALHRSILQWLEDCLRAMVGENRADTLKAFEPEVGWAELFDSSCSSVLGLWGGWQKHPGTGRRLIRRCGPFVGASTYSSGREAAWSIVKEARDNLIKDPH